MKISLVMLACLICCGVTSAADADPRLRIIADPPPINMPLWSEPNSKFKPWFDDCHARIAREMDKNPKSDLLKGGLACTFLLEADGNISDLFIYQSARSKEIDDNALNVINQAAPFEKPPEELLHKRRVLVIFTRGNDFRIQFDANEYKMWKDRDAEFQAVKQNHLKSSSN